VGSKYPRRRSRFGSNLIVVMDLRMKRVDGIEATRLLSERNGPPVLALTTFDNDELLSGVLRAGAVGFVLKDSTAARKSLANSIFPA
jgi:DNA-binding NarL/FixJ family response regulator